MDTGALVRVSVNIEIALLGRFAHIFICRKALTSSIQNLPVQVSSPWEERTKQIGQRI